MKAEVDARVQVLPEDVGTNHGNLQISIDVNTITLTDAYSKNISKLVPMLILMRS